MGARRNILLTIEELSLSGVVNIGKCCKRTMKNWVNDINNTLIRNNYSFRVVGKMEDDIGVISAIPKERYEAIKELL